MTKLHREALRNRQAIPSAKEYPLISLITPCYNGRQHIMPYIHGLLSQTYPNVEFIFVNDGSTDATEQTILSFKEKFEKKGWKFIYIYQDNKGQATALNQGLKVFTGQYLTWIDSDDILFPSFLEEHVDFLEANKICGFCYGKIQFAHQRDLDKVIEVRERVVDDGAEDNFFTDLIHMRNVPALAFCVTRSSALLRVLPNRQIFTGTAGQNWQLLLPLAYHYKCGYIKKILACCVVRTNSHSRSTRDYRQRYDGLEKILLETVGTIDMPKEEKQRYLDEVTLKYSLLREKLEN